MKGLLSFLKYLNFTFDLFMAKCKTVIFKLPQLIQSRHNSSVSYSTFMLEGSTGGEEKHKTIQQRADQP